MTIQIINGDRKDMAGGIHFTPQVLEEFKEIIGAENVDIIEA